VTIVLDNQPVAACRCDRQLGGAFRAICKAHDFRAQFVITRLGADAGEGAGYIGAFNLMSGYERCRPLAGGREPQAIGVQFKQAWLLGSGVAELEAQLGRVELRGRPGEEHLAVSDGMKGAGATEGTADFVTADRLADVMHDNQGCLGSIAEPQQ